MSFPNILVKPSCSCHLCKFTVQFIFHVHFGDLNVPFAVIDILRMFVLHPDGASMLQKHVGENGMAFLFWEIVCCTVVVGLMCSLSVKCLLLALAAFL